MDIIFLLGIDKAVSRHQYRQYKVISVNWLSKKSPQNSWPHQHSLFSNKITSEYIEKLKPTKECKRMWIQNKSQKSLMGAFSRGRLANQLNSFALQYAIWKVILNKFRIINT